MATSESSPQNDQVIVTGLAVVVAALVCAAVVAWVVLTVVGVTSFPQALNNKFRVTKMTSAIE